MILELGTIKEPWTQGEYLVGRIHVLSNKWVHLDHVHQILLLTFDGHVVRGQLIAIRRLAV